MRSAAFGIFGAKVAGDLWLNRGYMDSPCGQATPFESEAVLDCSSTFGLFVGTVDRARMMMRVSDNLIR